MALSGQTNSAVGRLLLDQQRTKAPNNLNGSAAFYPSCQLDGAALIYRFAMRPSRYLRPFGDVGLDALAQIVRRHAACVHAGGNGELLNFGRFQRVFHGVVECRDDVGRRSGGNREPIPACHLVAGQAALDHGRGVWQVAGALASGGGEHGHLVVGDRRLETDEIFESNIDIAAQHGIGEVRCRLIRNDGDVDAGQSAEQFGGQILRAAGINGAEVQRAGMRLCGGDDVLDGLISEPTLVVITSP